MFSFSIQGSIVIAIGEAKMTIQDKENLHFQNERDFLTTSKINEGNKYKLNNLIMLGWFLFLIYNSSSSFLC